MASVDDRVEERVEDFRNEEHTIQKIKRKKKKKKKKKKALKCDEESEVELEHSKDISEDSETLLEVKAECDQYEEEIKKCDCREKDKAVCDASVVRVDSAQFNEATPTVITTKKKKKKKRQQAPLENKEVEANLDLTCVNGFNNRVEEHLQCEYETNRSQLLQQPVNVTSSKDYPKHFQAATALENETKITSENKTKTKSKKNKNDAIEENKQVKVDDFKEFDTKETINSELFDDSVVNEGKSSSLPVRSHKKKKKRKAGGILLSELSLSKPRNDSDKEKDVYAVDEKEVRNEEQQLSKTSDDSDLKKCSERRSLLQPKANERNNFSKVLTITMGIGLDTLRKLFMKIHPTWSNKPDDAKNLVKGTMHLQKHELNRFNTGNINDWDVSLITTVLLYSMKCSKEIKKMGYEDAIRTIKEQKNLLISHKNTERMTDDEFTVAWDKISNSLVTIGARMKDIEDILIADDILESGKFYRDMFLQELGNKEGQRAVLEDINNRIENMGEVVAEKLFSRISGQPNGTRESRPRIEDFGPKFDEWMRFCEDVQNFDHHKNNYVLITDSMSQKNVEHFSVLRSVPWKIVLDFDPQSEEKGMYHDFVEKEGKNSLIGMITPDEIRNQHASTINLARHIDSRKTQWLFVRGREKDNSASGGVQTVHDWKSSSVKHISRFLSCCADPEKMDKHKPLICVILPFVKETLPFLEMSLERLIENFDEFRIHLVGVNQNGMYDLQKQFNIHLTDLNPGLLCLGLEDLLQLSPGKEYKMPTSQAKLQAKLTHHQYLFLQEYLDVLYSGCQDLPAANNSEDEEKLNKILNAHKQSFLSGNWISFVSLYDNHDARREVGDEVRIHIQRLLDQGRLTHSAIIEIRHSPGTGGTTIARRVLWDLHKSYPCAIVRLKDYKYDFDDDVHFINHLADRISALHDICQTYPLILLDGNHSRIEALSNKLVRVLNSSGQRAVLLRCLHRSGKPDDKETSETSDIHARFSVKVKLEDSLTDLNQFKEKYKDYIDGFQKRTTLCRVFHFPLLAMLKGLPGFDSKLKQIVHESFDEMENLQKEIAVVVAFIQHYASQETPGALLCKAFKEYVSKDSGKGITYKEINQLLTDQLLNLMVPNQPNGSSSKASSSTASETFTFQHPLVAEMVLKRYYVTQRSNTFKLTQEFLQYPIFQDEQFFTLVNDLFIRNKSVLPKTRFSKLFEELRSLNSRSAAKLFCQLAEKTGDAIVFAHAARFYAKNNPPSFQDATNLINQAFKCKNAPARSRILYDMKGQILQSQLKFMVERDKITTINQLEDLADKVLQSYRKSRNWPPTFLSPLLGEVQVWIACIEWITKNKFSGDTDKSLEFIVSFGPPFFRTCFGDSFYLLDMVDSIVQKEANLSEPEEIQKQANDLRMALLRTFNKDKGRAPGRREKDNDIIRACKALCSSDKLSKCSPVEIKRLQAHYILSSVDQIEGTKEENMDFLLKLLEDLVFKEKQSARVDMASHLMKVCLLITGQRSYSLDRGLSVAEIWMQQSGYDPMPYFFEMMIYFLKIMDGNLLYRSSYNKALDVCKEKSQNHCRKFSPTHFLKNSGEGMNRLMTRSSLLNGETEYHQNIVDFWTTHSRKKLMECSGRIRTRTKPGKRKQVYIELVQGNIELYVGKNADIGKVERDFNPGTMVYFVVSFTFEGPVANGIQFTPICTSTK